MARMDTGSQHFEEVRIDARLDGDRAERVHQHLDGTDKSGAELVREALDEYLGEDEPDGRYIRPPENEDLRRVWAILLVDADVSPFIIIIDWGGWDDWRTFRDSSSISPVPPRRPAKPRKSRGCSGETLLTRYIEIYAW